MQQDPKRQRCPECGTPDVRVIQSQNIDAMGHVLFAISAECPNEACMWHAVPQNSTSAAACACAEPVVAPVALSR